MFNYGRDKTKHFYIESRLDEPIDVLGVDISAHGMPSLVTSLIVLVVFKSLIAAILTLIFLLFLSRRILINRKRGKSWSQKASNLRKLKSLPSPFSFLASTLLEPISGYKDQYKG